MWVNLGIDEFCQHGAIYNSLGKTFQPAPASIVLFHQ